MGVCTKKSKSNRNCKDERAGKYCGRLTMPLQSQQSLPLTQAVCRSLKVNPELQRAHIAAPSTVQAASILGVPLGQLHTFRVRVMGDCELPPKRGRALPMLRLQFFKPYVKK